MAAYDVSLGRLKLVTATGELSETLGDSLEAIGAAIVAGERRARPFPLTLPVYGARSEDDPYEATLRIRRQARALIENVDVRLTGLYLALGFDPDLNGWLLAGGGDLKYGAGGVATGDFVLELSDCYRIATARAVRPARRLEARDRRLSTTPRDILGTVFSTDFAASTATKAHWLPTDITDPAGVAGAVLVPGSTTVGIDGIVPTVVDRPAGEVVSFIHQEEDHGKGDVLILDRQGAPAPAFTLAGDADPQAEYGWEEVYGTEQPLTAGDVPTLQNGVCRVRWVEATSSFAFDAYVAGSGYVEQGRFTIYRDSPAGTEAQYVDLVGDRAQVIEWTPERAVLLVRLGIGSTDRVDVYLTLQRGWSGPRVEAYASWSSAGKPGVVVRVVPATAGATTLGRSSGTVNPIVNGTDYGTFASIDPWLYLLGQSPNLGIQAAVLSTLVRVIGRGDTVAYGATRNGVSIAARDATAIEGYVSVLLGASPRATTAALAPVHGALNLYDCRAVPELIS